MSYELLSIEGDPSYTGGDIIPNNGYTYQMWFSVLIDDPNDVINEDIELDVITSVANHDISNKMSVFPNPAKDQITVNINTANASIISEIEVYDFNGHLIRQINDSPIPQRFHEWSFDTSTLTTGIYIIKAVTDSEILQSRFLKF